MSTKFKRLSFSTRFFLIAFIITAISFMYVGVSNIFAEPTIDELVKTPEIGTFEPSSYYDDDEIEDINLVAWLDMTQLMFSYDCWVDTSGDGVIDVEDVYTQEGFGQEMFMGSSLYPIFDIGEDENYYLITFPDYDDYNAVVVQFLISENNDLANMKDPSTYWYDGDNNYLYIEKSMIEEDIEQEHFNSIRAEVVMLTMEADLATKKVEVITLFDESIDNTYGLYNNTPNETMEYSLNDWELKGLEYQLVQPAQLAYVSEKNLEVYVNEAKMDEWLYDETTGYIVIDCNPWQTKSVAVKITAVNENVSMAQRALQFIQTASNEDVGQATSIDKALTGDNMFLTYVKYEDEEPKIGAYQEMEFTAFAIIDDDDGTMYKKPTTLWGSPPTTTIADMIEAGLANASKVDGHFQSATLAAFRSDQNNISDTNDNDAVDVYGEVLYNVYLAHQKGDNSYIDAALTRAESDLFSHVTHTNDHEKDAMLDTWDVWTDPSGTDGRYITGTSASDFLGGKILRDGGKAFFDVACARINAPSAAAKAEMDEEYGSKNNTDDYRTNATIVDISKDANGTGGYLYVCIWSRTMQNSTQKSHNQRILAFSRVRYEFDGAGDIQFRKIDGDTNVNLPGAVYTIYKDASCKTAVQSLTTGTKAVTSNKLAAGTYYIKETTAPTGYAKDDTVYEVNVVGGSTYNLVVKDSKQKCNLTFTVYDETTKGKGHEMPIPGIKFKLLDPTGSEFGEYVTNEDGQIKVSIPATGQYKLVQQNTAENYRMDTDTSSEHYCFGIVVNAVPSATGSNMSLNVVHYEQRQAVTIKTRIWDENLKEKTPAELGGDKEANSYVATAGATYQLIAKSKLFLGYENGEKVTVDAGQPLTILTYDQYGHENYAQKGYSHAENNESYLHVTGVKVNYKGKDLGFKLPNGEYEWKMVDASPGYYDNEASTTVDASWKEENNKEATIAITDSHVTQVRQTAEITLFVKSYTEKDKGAFDTEGAKTNIRNKALTSLLSKAQIRNGESTSNIEWQKAVDMSITKTVNTIGAAISSDSVEEATVYKDNQQTNAVTTSGLVPNAIYELSNLSDIVDIKTGEIIEGGVDAKPLGRYIADENGKITVTKLGTAAFDNPNEESNKGLLSKIKAVKVTTKNGTATSGPLPNGIYVFSIVTPADKHKAEDGLHEDIIEKELMWNLDRSEEETLKTNAVVMLVNDTDPYTPPKLIPAPDVPVDNTDPYDPLNPDDPSGDPDDSKDITLVDKEWINENQFNIAYRIADLLNFEGEEDEEKEYEDYDVKDSLPTTFAFYINRDLQKDDTHEYFYDLSFYYEVTEAEYNSATTAQKSNNEYVKIGDNSYARRFATDTLSGGEWLKDNIVLNAESEGYISYAEVKENLPVSGAIYNSDWLNEQLLKQPDGEFKIYACVDVRVEYFTKISDEKVVIDYDIREYGAITIKDRHLYNLD